MVQKFVFYAGHPIHGPDGSRIGTLCVSDHQPRNFSAEDAALLVDLAAMVERELELVDRASTDVLTHLSNRRGFITVATQVLALCRRNRQPAVIVVVDLDSFKTVNDKHGHEAGDAVLRLFAKMLFAHFRSSDVIARLGGDEFGLLCSGTNSAQLAASLETLANEFSSSVLVREYPDLSWSAGMADFHPDSSDTVDALLRVADRRMYRAKSDSRRKRQLRC